MADCKQSVLEAAKKAGIEINAQTAQKIVDRALRYSKALVDSGRATSLFQAYGMASERLVGDLALQRAKTIRATLLDIQAARRIVSNARLARDSKKDYAFGMRAHLEGGLSGSFFGVGRSQDAVARFRFKSLLADYTARVELDGLQKADQDPAIQRDVFVEMWELSNEKPVANVTGNKVAYQLAQHRMATINKLYGILTRAGDILVKREGWANPQTWSQDRLVRLGKGSKEQAFRAWKALVLPHIDPVETFQGVDPEKWLLSFFDNIYTGDYTSGGAKKRGADAGSVGSMGARRKLIFRNASGAYIVNEAVGLYDARDGFLNYLRLGANHSARLEFLGANPEKAWSAAYNQIMEEIKTQDDADVQADAMKSQANAIAFKIASGITDQPGDARAAKALSVIQGGLVLSTQGATIISAVTSDPVLAAMRVTLSGFSVARLLSNFGLHLVGGKDAYARKRLAFAGVGFEGAAGVDTARFSQHEVESRRVVSWINNLFKFQGLTAWTDRIRAAYLHTFMAEMADAASTSYKNLLPENRRLLETYGIESQDWDFFRKTVEEHPTTGEKWMTGDFSLLKDADVEAAKSFYGSDWTSVLEERWNVMVNQEAYTAVMEPGARERRWTTLGMRAGTWGGAAIRVAAFLKSFPIGVWNRHVLEMKAHGSLHHMFGYIAASMVMGYMSMLIRDTLAGKTPKQLFNDDGEFQPNLLKDMLQRGGILGLWGDVFLQEYNRGFRDVSSYIGGPMFQKLFDPIGSAASKVARLEVPGDEIALLPELLPFSNLILARQAFDLILGYHIREMLSPGSIDKMKENLRNNYGQEFYDWADPEK